MSDGIKAWHEEQEARDYRQQLEKMNEKISTLGASGLLRELEKIQEKANKLTDSDVSLKRYQHVMLDDIIEIVNGLLD